MHIEDKTTAITFTRWHFFGPMVKVWPALVLLSLVLLLAWFEKGGLGLAEKLRYTDHAPSYRWLSAHYVHLGVTHALLNVAAGLMVLRLFREVWEPWHWWVLGGVLPLAICASFYLFNYPVSWYVGLSGVLHGWFSWCLVLLWREQRLFALLGVIGIVLKLGVEWQFPQSVFSENLLGGNVITAAHRLGTLYGVIFALLAGLASNAVHTTRKKLKESMH